MRYRSIILLAIAMLSASLAQSQSDSIYRNNIMPSPSMTYSPETDIVLGLFLLYQFKPAAAGPETRPSFLNVYYATSAFKQSSFSHEHKVFTVGEKLYVEGLIEYKFWPEAYFGIGTDTREEDLLIANYTTFKIDQRVFWNTGQDLFVGPQIKVLSIADVSFDNSEGNEVPLPSVEGNKGGTDIGFGAGATFDKRNSILTPTQNFFLELSTHLYSKSLGSSRSFSTIKFDARKYFNLSEDGKNVLAIQGLMNFSMGSTPFYELGKVGGKSILRGYLEGRFRDNHAVQIQGEFRKNLIGRFGFTVFGALGNVASRVNDFEFSKTKIGVGAGLRFNINRKDPANVRIDFGWTPESTGVYITFGEAF